MSAAAPRSTFVTALAWVFIVLSGFGTFIALLQNIMIFLMFPAAEMRAAMEQAPKGQDVPWMLEWMVAHFYLFFLGFLVLCAIMLAASIGLLLRKNWARITFVALMGLGIAWNVVGVILMFAMFAGMLGGGWGVPGPQLDQRGAFYYVFLGFNLIFVAAFCALFAWIIKRLTSAEIRREFISSQPAP